MLNVSTRARIKAPTATPANDSKPPKTMITKARIRNDPPKSGVKEYIIARRPPAAPAKAMPIPKAICAVRSTFTPAIRPASGFCINARTARPNHVLCKTNSRPPSEATATPKTTRRIVGKMMGPIAKVEKVLGVRMARSALPQIRYPRF
jgi:hypothetical protein